MNYRHAFHAGNRADVVKHAVLCLILSRLTQKPTPLCVLDTHAGLGLYDLEGESARRTGEADTGIRWLATWTPPTAAIAESLAPYLAAVRALNPAWPAVTRYPGSPSLARAMMRPGDRLVAVDLHPEDVQALKAAVAGDRQVEVHHMDGWLALKAHLPPRERRGLVLIDPPFEVPDEYDRLVQGLRLAHARWASGCYALWYPVKEKATTWRLHQNLENTGIPKILAAELTWAAFSHGGPLAGCGMILVNPPWQVDTQLAELLPVLARAWGGPTGTASVTWIREG